MTRPTTSFAPVGSGPLRGSAGRDSFVDLLRVFAIAAVVLQHWAFPVLQYSGGEMTVSSALLTPETQLITWLSQVMPLFFFAGGAVNAISWRSAAGRGKTASSWLAARLGRLSFPVLAVAAVWIPLPYLLNAAGMPDNPVDVAAFWVARVLWFLPVYLICVVCTPLAVRLAKSRPVSTMAVLVTGAVVVDFLRWTVGEPIGYLNMAFVWLAVHQLGVMYSAGQLRFLTVRRAAAVSAAAFGAVAVMVATGPYPVLMLALPGAGPANHAPPTLCLLVLSVALLALALALRPALLKIARNRIVERTTAFVAARMMTIYIWHMTALMVGAGICVVALGVGTPEALSTTWWTTAPVWIGLLVALLAPLVRIFGRLEAVPMPRRPENVGPVRVAVATVLVGLGLLGITIAGFAPSATPLTGAIPAAAAVVAGLVLLNTARARQPALRS